MGNDSCPPHEKRKPDIVGGAYPHGPRRFAPPVGAGPRPARRVRLLFTAAPRRGGPRGRPPQHTPRPLGMCPRTGCGPTLPHRRRRGQSRNCRRTLCAPTKNVIGCGGRMISAPTQHVVPIPRADNIRPYEKRESGVGNGACPPHEKRKPDIVGGAYPHGPRRFAPPVGAGPRPARRVRLLFTAAPP